MPEDGIFDGPVTNLLSVLCILIELFWRAHVKGGKKLNGFKSGTFIGRFLSDGNGRVKSMAVKGLKITELTACRLLY